MCPQCAPTPPRQAQSIAAEQEFRARIAEFGGKVVGEWREAHTAVATVCPMGHECNTLPPSIRNGAGMCSICGVEARARTQRRHGEAKFRARVVEFGGQVIGDYVNSRTRVDCRCPAGHACRPRPSHLLQGVGMCPVCSQRDSSTAGDNFRCTVEEQGAEMLGTFAGAHTRVLVRCSAGHFCHPIPNQVRQGGGLCPTCTGRDPVVAEARFRRAVADANAEMLGEYVTARVPVLLRCAAGHLTSPTPDAIQQGQGVCKQCWYDWSTFYVLINRALGRIKFGVTSSDPRPRIKAHRGRGYTETVRVLRDFPDAFRREQHVIATLRDAGIAPAHGRECYDAAALPVVLDGWSGTL